MNARVIGIWVPGLVSACGVLLLVGCSSQERAASGSDAAADVAEVAGVVVDSIEQPEDGANCGVSSHTLVRQEPPSDCTFALDQVPPVPSNVRVQVGATAIPPNDLDGWVYEPGMLAITLSGSWCQRVRDGTITEIRMLFGCPTHPIP